MGVIGDHKRTKKALSSDDDDDDHHHPQKGKEEAHDEEDVLPGVFEVKMRNYVPRGDCGVGAESSMKTTILPNEGAAVYFYREQQFEDDDAFGRVV